MEVDESDATVPIVPVVRQQFEYLHRALPFLDFVHDEKMAHQWCLRGMSPRHLDLRIVFHYFNVNGSSLHSFGVPHLNEWFKRNDGVDPGNANWQVTIGEARLSSFDGVLAADKVLTSIATLMSTQADDGQESIIPVPGHASKQCRIGPSDSSEEEKDAMDVEEVKPFF